MQTFQRLADPTRMPNLLQRAFLAKVALFWILAVVVGSLLPQPAKSVLGTSPRNGQEMTARIAWTHRAVHFAAFGSTALFLLLVARSTRQRQAAILTTVALGAGIEMLQHAIYRSEFESCDVRDDALAACLVYLLWFVVRRWPAQRRNALKT